MLYVTLITVGDLPKGPFTDLADNWRKQLKQYVKLDHKVVDDEQKITKQIPQGDMVFVLDEQGQLFSTKQIASAIQILENQGTHITVIIGGPKGLSMETKKIAKVLLSISPMTTTHDLAHLFFLEQLYRIMTIIHGKEYHY